ncbi:MAG: uracil-DNA glycosylase [Candidatus Nomurabacteria bacterium]|jgi:uracil-DNA glycosylase|nr:uracil-DNA glycosylase [Candidatus Nomurabacteria bacterium]
MKKLEEIMAPDWAAAMQPVEPDIRAMGEFLRAEVSAGRRFLPAPERIFRAFQTPLEDVKVLIVGQDPYPTPSHPIGLSFAVAAEVRPLPKSLQNIYQELSDDLGVSAPADGDLSRWAEQGVMLLNRNLSVEPSKPNSHQGKGWEKVTEAAVQVLNERDKPMVAILWGANARQLKAYLTSPKIKVIESVHPSPLSAHAGFFGSKPFSQANEFLEENGVAPVKWVL